MSASSNPPIEQPEGTVARKIEDMSLTELHDTLAKLEEAKACSAKLVAAALKSLAKLHSGVSLELMTGVVKEVGRESCGEKQSYADIVNMVLTLVSRIRPGNQAGVSAGARVDPGTPAADDPDDAKLQSLYEYMKRLMNAVLSKLTSNLAIILTEKEAAEKVSKENADDKSIGEVSIETPPNSAEMEVEPNAPEFDVQSNAPELEVQLNASELENQTNAPALEVQPIAPELEVQPNAQELEVQTNAPELEVQPHSSEHKVRPNAQELEVQLHSFNPEVAQSQSSDPEVPSTASSILSQYSRSSSDGSVTDDIPSNYDELQNRPRSSKPQVQSDSSNLTFPISSDESSEDQSNSAVGSSADQSNSAVGSSADQSNSTFGSCDSEAHSSEPHSSDRSPDGRCPHSLLAPAGVYVNLEVGLAYIAHFTTTAQHQEYLLNIFSEIMYSGRKIFDVKRELTKRKDQTDIPSDTLPTAKLH